MPKKTHPLFLPFLLMVTGTWITPAMSASFALHHESFFFGQRGAGVAIAGVNGTTEFGHPVPVSGSSLAVDLHGIGSASQTYSVGGGSVHEVGEQLSHGIQVEFSEADRTVGIDLFSRLTVDGELPTALSVKITNDLFGNRSYADASAKTVLEVVGNPGEPVRVHIDAWASSNTSGSFDTEVSLAAGFPNNFRIMHNDTIVWIADTSILDPNGDLLQDDLLINAVVGDTITVDAAVLANLWGTVTDTSFSGNYANVSFNAVVDLEPVPIPSAVWFLGSGLFSLFAVWKNTGGSSSVHNKIRDRDPGQGHPSFETG